MRVTVVGAGAVGCTFGGQLLRAGHRVTFVARGPRSAAIRDAGGVTVHSAEYGTTRLPAACWLDADAAGCAPADLVMLTCKADDAAGAAPLLACILAASGARRPGLLPIWNAVDGWERVARELPGGYRRLLGCASIETTQEDAATVRHHSKHSRILFGAFAGPPGPYERGVGGVLRQAGIDATVARDARAAAWRLGAGYVPLAALTAYYQQPIGAVMGTPEGERMARALAAEYAAVGAAAGYAQQTKAEAVLFALGRMPRALRSSLARDAARGTRPELDGKLGAVVRYGRRYGVPTPTFDVVLAAVAGLTAAGAAPAR